MLVLGFGEKKSLIRYLIKKASSYGILRLIYIVLPFLAVPDTVITGIKTIQDFREILQVFL